MAQAMGNRVGGGGTGQPGSASASALSTLTLQGIFMTPSGHAALINGTPVSEGETADIPGGPQVFARKIGDNYAVVEAWGQTKVLKLEDPSLAQQPGAPGQSGSAASSTPRAAANTSAAPTAPPVNHGGGTDPYAGHRTGHH